MELLMYFLGNYGNNFAVALSIWPFASFLLTLPIVALLYHRNGNLKARTVGAAYLSVLYALSLVCFTLYPLPSGTEGLGITYGIAPQLSPIGFIGDLSKDGLHAVPQILANIAFFIPLGFIAHRLFRLQIRGTLIVGFSVSLLIETAQLTGLFFIYPYSYRTFDVCDLLWNTSGTAIGLALAFALGRIAPAERATTLTRTHNPGFIRRTTAFCLDMLLIWLITFIAFTATQVLCALLQIENEIGLTAANYCGIAAGILAFLFVEFIIPWFHEGSTPGGRFVRMSFETMERSAGWRMAFYTARIATFASLAIFNVFGVMVLGGFYLLKRCMPYDLIPAYSPEHHGSGLAQLKHN